MSIVLPTLAVAFAAFCVWLAVRIVNRQERWAKRTVWVLVVALAYPLSFGPACWIVSRRNIDDDGMRKLPWLYTPLGWAVIHSGGTGRQAMQFYGSRFMPRGTVVAVPVRPSKRAFTGVYGR